MRTTGMWAILLFIAGTEIGLGVVRTDFGVGLVGLVPSMIVGKP